MFACTVALGNSVVGSGGRQTNMELFISDDHPILTWFFRVEVRPLLYLLLFLLVITTVPVCEWY